MVVRATGAATRVGHAAAVRTQTALRDARTAAAEILTDTTRVLVTARQHSRAAIEPVSDRRIERSTLNRADCSSFRVLPRTNSFIGSPTMAFADRNSFCPSKILQHLGLGAAKRALKKPFGAWDAAPAIFSERLGSNRPAARAEALLEFKHLDIAHVGQRPQLLLNDLGHDLIDAHNGDSVLLCGLAPQVESRDIDVGGPQYRA